MALSATDLYVRYREDHDVDYAKLEGGDGGKGDPLNVHQFHLTRTAEESKQINNVKTPCIIVSASGMISGGRVLHHLAQRLPDSRNAVVLAAGLCGLAGAAISPIQLVTPYMGQFLLFKAFALIIIGGLGNIPGAIVAGIGLGLIENWIGGFFEIAWQEAAVFVIMIAVLFLRPDGLFKRGGMRVG